MARIKVRPAHREELPGLVLLLDAAAGRPMPGAGPLDLDMEINPDLQHIMSQDPDGFIVALEREETVGFAASHVRSQQWVLSELCVLPQHRGRGAGEALLSRAVAYGERSGAKSFLALVAPDGAVESLLLRHQLHPLTPVYEFAIDRTEATRVGAALSRLLPGVDVSQELLGRRGQADLDRIDRLTRGITREADHVYWLKERGFNAAFVRQGTRVAAYAYGGAQTGPAAGSTQEAALAALGWAVELSLAGDRAATLRVHLPAPFTPALDALLDGGARLERTLLLYGRHATLSLDRMALGVTSLP